MYFIGLLSFYLNLPIFCNSIFLYSADLYSRNEEHSVQRKFANNDWSFLLPASWRSYIFLINFVLNKTTEFVTTLLLNKTGCLPNLSLEISCGFGLISMYQSAVLFFIIGFCAVYWLMTFIVIYFGNIALELPLKIQFTIEGNTQIHPTIKSLHECPPLSNILAPFLK